MYCKASFLKKSVLSIWLLAAAFGAQAATFYVSPTGNDVNNGTSWTSAKQTIQAGINVATSGDTILVTDGTYLLTSQISISPGVTVRSANGAQTTIIDGGGVTRCVYMNANAALDGFMVTNGYASDSGGGIYAYGSTIENCIISDNSAYHFYSYSGSSYSYSYYYGYGGGVRANYSTLRNCTISGNMSAYGGGIYAYGGTIIENCTISSNTAYEYYFFTNNNGYSESSYWGYGGGVYGYNSTLRNCIINGNASGYGGGIYAYGGTIIENCTISSNTAYEYYFYTNNNGYSGSGYYGCGGGVEADYSTVRNCTIRGNMSSYGGGILTWVGTVENCTISSNTAYEYYFYTNNNGYSESDYWGCGGGVEADYSTLRNCTISGNTTYVDGGGVNAYYSTVENCTISGNTAYWAGGVFAWKGTVQNCTISGNSAFSGGGMEVGATTVRNCTISGNGAVWGGGVEVWFSSSTVEDCLIIENWATYGGGGVLAVQDSTVQNCTISSNVTISSDHPAYVPTVFSCGGGVLTWNGKVQNCTIKGNWSADYGGGIYAFGAGCQVQNCTLSENTTYFDGGGIYLRESTARNCLISGNTAFGYGGGVCNVSSGTVENCTISGNEAAWDGGVYVESGTARNCIAYYNQNGDVNGAISYSCFGVGINVTGIGNITNEPQFVSTGTGYGANLMLGNYHLQPASSCINAGTNQSWMTDAVDLDGRPRVLRGTVDMGAYEGSQADIIIMRSPAILSNRCGYGSNAIGQTIEVWNAGTGTMAYALSANVNWLLLSPASGTSTGETDFVNVSYESAGLALGIYTGIVSITSAEACNSPQVVTVYLWVDKIGQTITFPPIASQPVTGRVGLAATASSGLPVNFAVVSGPGVINAGTNMSFTAAGTVRVVASQGGDAIYNPAPNVTIAVAVERISQTITFPAIPDQTVTPQVGLAATASSGLPVSFAVASGPGTISGGTNLSFTAVGTVRVVASQAGNTIYNPAPSVTNAVAFVRIGQTIYVSPVGNDANNGTSWELAKQTIQAGINVATVGDTVLVSDGTFTLTNQVSISPGVTVRSVNGAQATTINGGGVTRCVYMNMNAMLDGFTVSKGYACGSRGGGVYVAGGTVQNCTISGNSAVYYYINGGGGGVYVAGGTVKDCTISGNSGNWGGGVDVYYGTVENCTIIGNSAIYDGGVFLYGGTLKNCTISGNWASAVGGGVNAYLGTLENCTISGNSAYEVGGTWLLASTVRNCTISGNSAAHIGGIEVLSSTVENCTISRNWASSGGGVYVDGGTVRNCIVYYNQNTDVIGPISYSCVGTDIGGVGNITNAPQFVSTGAGYDTNHVPGDYRLRPTSPCINAGINQSWMATVVDLDGLPRILCGVVDMGAYEWSATNTIMRNPTIILNRCNYGSNAIGQMIEVWNAGTGAMAYALSANANWLSLSPASGTSIGETDLVDINYNSAGLVPGSYTGIVTITSAEAINSPQTVTVYLLVDKADQTITFPPIATQVVTSGVWLAATVSSGLPVNFAVVSGPGIISDGTNLTFTAVGTVQVVASQSGNDIYDPAPNVTNVVLVERASQTITFPAIPDQVATSRVGLVATASSGLPVSFAVVSGPGVIIGGTNLSFTAAGSVLVEASQEGDTIFNPAPEVMNSFSVTKATAIVTLHNLNQIYNGTARSVTATTVPEGLTVEITYDGSSSAPTDVGRYSVSGVVNDTIYEGSANGTLTVEKADQTITSFTPTNGATFAATSTVGLAAQASSGLLVTNFAVLSGPGVISGLTNLTFTNSGAVRVTADQAGNNNWNPAPAVTNTVLVERVSQTITFPAIPAQVVTSQVGLTATASSGLPVSFAMASGPGTIVGGTNLSFTATGSVLVKASQAGNTIYNPAPEVMNSFSVTKATAIVTLHNLNQIYNGAARSVTASTVPEGLTVEITYDGISWAPTDAGRYSVSGVVNDSIYEGSVNGTLTVAKADQTITSFTPTNGANFAATSTVGLAAQASSGLLVTNFAVLSGPGVISGLTNLTFTNSGTLSVTADQAGNNNWNPAPAVTNSVMVERVGQTITFLPIPAQVVTSKVGLAATASSGLPVSFAVVSGPGVISGGMNLSFTAAGIVQVAASQSGNAIYNPAPDLTNTVAVGRARQTIAFPSIPTQVVTSQVGLAATAISGLPVSFAVASGPGLIVGGTNLLFSSTGVVCVAASQAGDSMWEVADSVTNAIMVMNPPAGEIMFAQTNMMVNENIVNVELRVIRTNGNYGVISVDYTNQGVTASIGLDFGVVTGRLTWADGDASDKTITIAIVDDSVDESNEVFEVVLTNAVGTSIIGTNAACVTIVDNDGPGTVQFSSSSCSVDENAGTVTLTVTRTGGSSGSATVEYFTSEGTATAGSDYTSRSGTLTWTDGDSSSKTITITIIDDALEETEETFTVTLSNAIGAGLGSPSSATVTIVDNDLPPAGMADIAVAEFKWVPKVLQKLEHPSDISFVLRNDGPADMKAPDTAVEARFYLSGNMIFGDGDDILVGTKQGDLTLAVGEQMTVRYNGQAHNTDVTIPDGISGDYYVFMSVAHVLPSGLVDPDGAYAMRDGPITIGKPSDEERKRAVVNDYDGDGQSDMMVYDEPSGEWAIRLSESGEWVRFVFGGPGYETVSGDYDGDLTADPAVHDKSGSQWYVMLSGMEYQPLSFDFGGESETKGTAGDYNGDGLAEPGLYEEKSGRWYLLLPNIARRNYEVASVVLGGPGYAPVSGDYDGDGRTDPAVYEEETGEWRVMLSDKGYGVVSADFGGPEYRPVPGDYDGDGKTDLAIMSASGGWYYRLSSRSYALSGPDAFGKSGKPVPGDYDGDGKADPAIMSASGGWYFWLSSSFYIRAGPYYLVLP